VTAAKPKPPRLLRPFEVAELFGVHRKAVGRWAEAGRLTTIRTLGGHRRFLEDEVHQLLEARRTGPTNP
jgi:excisionase family DNA binding protein